MNRKQRERQAQRDDCNREELVERMGRAIHEDGRIERLKGVYFARSSLPAEPVHGVMASSLCVIAQGRKEVCLGEKRYQYDPYNYLVASLELPVTFRVLEASEQRPYLGLRMDLEPALVGSVLLEANQLPPGDRNDANAMNVSPLDSMLLDAVVRLVRLLDSPSDAHLLLPLIKREIIYRLLVGQQSDRLRRMTLLGGHTHRIAQAVEKICRDFSQPLRVEEMARGVGMSVSGFHSHFKAVTAMSPLQFQKHLRLREARRLLLGEHLDVATAGFRVGYEDASHFNRDYKRFFGAPPLRDVERLREAVGAEV